MTRTAGRHRAHPSVTPVLTRFEVPGGVIESPRRLTPDQIEQFKRAFEDEEPAAGQTLPVPAAPRSRQWIRPGGRCYAVGEFLRVCSWTQLVVLAVADLALTLAQWAHVVAVAGHPIEQWMRWVWLAIGLNGALLPTAAALTLNPRRSQP